MIWLVVWGIVGTIAAFLLAIIMAPHSGDEFESERPRSSGLAERAANERARLYRKLIEREAQALIHRNRAIQDHADASAHRKALESASDEEILRRSDIERKNGGWVLVPELFVVIAIVAFVLITLFAGMSMAQDSGPVIVVASANSDDVMYDAMEARADLLEQAAEAVDGALSREAACREALRYEQEVSSALHVELTGARAALEPPSAWYEQRWVERLGIAAAGAVSALGALLTAQAASK